VTVFVEVVGHGPSLTLLHGWGLNGAVWNSVRDALKKRFTLHIVDLPGHGHSKSAAIMSLSAMVDTVAGAMPRHSYLLGWSLGGQIALELARCHSARVDKLLLVATTPCFLQREDWSPAVLPSVLDDFCAQLSSDAPATIKRFLALQVLRQPNRGDAMMKLQQALAARGSVDADALATGLEILRNTDLRGRLAEIKQPTLVLQGDNDALTPEPAGRWLADHLPDARYVKITDAAHAPFLSHHDTFLCELTEFLTA
jgi:pimeloyl-[acyl-carrier protein] methyl ester esterase